MQRKRRSVGDGARPWLGLGLALAVAVAVAAWLLCGREAAARPRLFRASELARYRGGAAEPGLYLALLGRVFDVAAGRAHYTRGGAYEGLAGKLIGRFYEENGDPTSALLLAEATMAQGDASRETENQQRQHFPACNSEWRSGSLGRFWCSKQSGGVNRDWTGVPRKLYRPGGKKPRCVCVRTTGPPTGQKSSASHGDRGDLDNPSLQEYSGCPPLASSCILQD
ncbi:neuferricin isoform X2 [Trichosurus vulpecula]|uniref:neuferricin isoform X2 n=1 Tax=Trichosurus vulpecula TaxID=9337 RepID=UPI00186B31F2|nr:neuferricin isoform X2 [Trichosurus vulpecula]